MLRAGPASTAATDHFSVIAADTNRAAWRPLSRPGGGAALPARLPAPNRPPGVSPSRAQGPKSSLHECGKMKGEFSMRAVAGSFLLTAAEQLRGRTLKGGWRVLDRIEMSPTATGGRFSVCYLAESETGQKAFLKALDFSEALDAPDPARALQAMTEAYNFERDLLAKCGDRNMDRVVRAIDDGSIRIDGAPAGGVVQYLILELADRDVRLHLAFAGQVDLAWKLRSLHHIATGLMQLHSAGIAHQDVKPSNVLVFEQKTSKVGGFGTRCLRRPYRTVGRVALRRGPFLCSARVAVRIPGRRLAEETVWLRPVSARKHGRLLFHRA
jgi:Protein kinase domain